MGNNQSQSTKNLNIIILYNWYKIKEEIEKYLTIFQKKKKQFHLSTSEYKIKSKKHTTSSHNSDIQFLSFVYLHFFIFESKDQQFFHTYKSFMEDEKIKNQGKTLIICSWNIDEINQFIDSANQHKYNLSLLPLLCILEPNFNVNDIYNPDSLIDPSKIYLQNQINGIDILKTILKTYSYYYNLKDIFAFRIETSNNNKIENNQITIEDGLLTYTSFKQLSKVKIALNFLLIGPAGSGKSSFINIFLGEQRAFSKCGGNSVTKHIYEYRHKTYPIVIYDSEGFQIGKPIDEGLSRIKEKIEYLDQSKNEKYEQIHGVLYIMNDSREPSKEEENFFKQINNNGRIIFIIKTFFDEKQDKPWINNYNEKLKEKIKNGINIYKDVIPVDSNSTTPTGYDKLFKILFDYFSKERDKKTSQFPFQKNINTIEDLIKRQLIIAMEFFYIYLKQIYNSNYINKKSNPKISTRVGIVFEKLCLFLQPEFIYDLFVIDIKNDNFFEAQEFQKELIKIIENENNKQTLKNNINKEIAEKFNIDTKLKEDNIIIEKDSNIETIFYGGLLILYKCYTKINETTNKKNQKEIAWRISKEMDEAIKGFEELSNKFETCKHIWHEE